MKLAQVVADGRPGGGTTMVLGLIDELRLLAQCSITVVSQPGSYLQFEVERRGLGFEGFDFFGGMFNARLPWQLDRVLAGQQFDVSHLHGLRAAHHATQLPVRPRLGQLVYTVHGLHQLSFSAFLRWIANLADRRVMRRASHCVFVSQADRAAAQQWNLISPNAPAIVIPNGIDFALARNRDERKAVVDVLFVGRLEAQKDPMTAARILAALCVKGYRCALAGDGRLRADCQRLLGDLEGGDRVQLLGALSHEQALDLMASSRVLLMPSRWEGLPILPMEAMALGIPVVASRLPGVEEVMPNGEGGLLVDVGDVRAAIQAVEMLLNDAEQRQRCIDAGASRVARCFDRADMARRYHDLYKQAMT